MRHPDQLRPCKFRFSKLVRFAAPVELEKLLEPLEKFSLGNKIFLIRGYMKNLTLHETHQKNRPTVVRVEWLVC